MPHILNAISHSSNSANIIFVTMVIAAIIMALITPDLVTIEADELKVEGAETPESDK